MTTKISVEKMKKHLRLYNKNVREDLIISGIAKMKQEEVKKIFNKRFFSTTSGGVTHYVPSSANTNYQIPQDRFTKMLEASKEIMKGEKKAKPKPDEPKPELEKERQRVMKILDTKPFKNKSLASYRGAPTVDFFYGNMLNQQKTIKGVKEVERLIREWEKKQKDAPKKEDKPKVKAKTLKSLVAIAQSHKKNGITQQGLKAFKNMVDEYQKTNPPKLESQLAGVLYNYLLNNIFLKKKRLPNNLNRALKQLGFKTF